MTANCFRSDQALAAQGLDQQTTTSQRHGLTLLEVMLALGIFLVAMTAIGQLITLGSRASVEARLEADAVLRAETALSEVLAGVHPMQTAAALPFDDDPNWQWGLTVSEGPHVDLVRLDVTAYYQPPGESPTGTVTLSRLTRSPDLFLEAALAAEE
ncbi:MAG: prepilin-type N-terminal cleavage/methylation domain-containing protein [Planctomycetaceae bacterium]